MNHFEQSFEFLNGMPHKIIKASLSPRESSLRTEQKMSLELQNFYYFVGFVIV